MKRTRRCRNHPARRLHPVALAAFVTLAACAAPAGAVVVTWSAGNLADQGFVNPQPAADTLNIVSGSYKYVDADLATQGVVNWSDDLYFKYAHGFANSGTWNVLADVAMINNYGGGSFANAGVLRKSAGSGNASIQIGFSNSGVIDVQSGTISFDSGGASFADGTRFTGTGVARVAEDASFSGTITSQNLLLSSGAFQGSGARIEGSVVWIGGKLTGDWQVDAGQQLAVAAGTYKYIEGEVVNLGTMAATDQLYFNYGHSLTNAGVYDLQGDVGLSNSYGGGSIVNTGTLRKSAGSGNSIIGSGGSLSFDNSGTLDVQTGTLRFEGGGATFRDGTLMTGAGHVKIVGGARFIGGTEAGSLGSGARLTLESGIFVGGDGSTGTPNAEARLSGIVDWTGGTLNGQWRNPAGSTLNVAAGTYKFLDGDLVNEGTLALQDTLYFTYNHLLTNASLLDLQGDYGLSNSYGGGMLTNDGVLRKSAGNGTSSVGAGMSFVNNATILAQSGIISFDSGAATFNSGSVFSGAGVVRVSANASFNGDLHSDNLLLTGGTLTGGDARIAGTVRWSAGTLEGGWTVGSGAALLAQGSGTKTIGGSLTNQGTLRTEGSLGVIYSHTLDNRGLMQLVGDVGVFNSYGGGNFVNGGTLVKTEGSGVSDLSTVAFSNLAGGVVDVQAGSIRLPSNFANAGTLTGAGHFATNTLTNAGHVAPGESTGTLTIDGHFAQTAAGSLDIELQTLAVSDLLLVNGNATLDGTLALSCWGACSFTLGQQVVVLDATGTLSGSFAAVTYSGFSSDAFELIYDTANARVLLQATDNVSAVPEPAGWALWLVGLLGLGGWVRRRTAVD